MNLRAQITVAYNTNKGCDYLQLALNITRLWLKPFQFSKSGLRLSKGGGGGGSEPVDCRPASHSSGITLVEECKNT